MTDPLGAHTDYGSESLTENSVHPDPHLQFRGWLDHAAAEGVYEPNAMVLSTIDPDGAPSSRTVLLRGIHDDGFEFFTDYDSRKGRALMSNPRASLVFPWYTLHRQVIIYGAAHRTTSEVSDAYFAGRPHGSRIAATASEQSRPIADRETLEQRVAELEAEYPGDVPRPDNWGGFRVAAERVEFWQGRTSRLHDRILYTRSGDGWTVQRLQP